MQSQSQDQQTPQPMQYDSQPLTQALTVPSPFNGPSSVPSGQDAPLQFDSAPLTSALSVPAIQASDSSDTAPRKYADNPYMDLNPTDSPAMKALKGTNAVGAGIGEGLLQTINGTADIIGLPHKTLQAREDELKEQNASNPYLRSTGLGSETLSEFLLGDEALKGLALSDKLLKASKAAKTIEASPRLTRVVQAGIRALSGATLGTLQSELKSGGSDQPSAITSGLVAGVGNAVIPEAFNAVKAAPKAVTAISEALRGPEAVVQPELQGAIGKILKDVAKDHGLVIPEGTAIRDSAETVGQSIKGKGSAIYKSIDNALGGTRFQAYDEQLSTVRRAFRNDTGIDHDYTGRLIERINDLEDAKAAAQQQAIDAGISPDAFTEANRLWRQGSAMQDLSAKIRQSTSGLPSELQDGSASHAAGEVVSPSKLASKVHALRDSGRLSQALSRDLTPDRANDLLRAVENANGRTKQIIDTSKIVSKIGTGAAVALGAGGAGAAVVHHLTN